jgi:hypothetical protein
MTRFLLIGLFVALVYLLFAPISASAQRARDREIHLIQGLDGAPYESYLPEVVQQVQQALQEEGYYKGEITGTLDEDTMRALGEFQKEHQLAVTGVPTPRTRELLLRK